MISLLIIGGVSVAHRRQDPKQRVYRQQPAVTPTSYTFSHQNATTVGWIAALRLTTQRRFSPIRPFAHSLIR